ENLQRKQIKGLMREWEKKYPGRVESIFSSLSTVVPSHLMDRDMFGFKDLKADGEANPLGDIAFDDEPCSTPTGYGTIPLLFSA
ncbi:MAG TPA: tRNA 2-thiocytidine(32) synthetase TtcA, partial [Telluria sp.]|nr:tRNA 2-thiocytidine(32) synthetase TtcA [Telluria sp.]